jgi:hypothetical protein
MGVTHHVTDPPGRFRLVRRLYGRAWLTAERPSLLFDRAAAWCVKHEILLPGISQWTRLVARERERT